MGYLHIENLYRKDARNILLEKSVYVMEKVHGTSAHLAWRKLDGNLTFFSGGEKHAKFVSIFSGMDLKNPFPGQEVTVFGEAYGGSCQGMKHTYGPDLRFIAFDVQVDGTWLTVPEAAKVAESLGLEFVPWLCVDLPSNPEEAEEVLNRYRDLPSEVAQRRGCGVQPREGIVIRPLIEKTNEYNARVIVKHKGAAFAERLNVPTAKPGQPLEVLQEANAIATEWVTPMRLAHVLDKLPEVSDISQVKRVIDAMIEDVLREGSGEIVDSPAARSTISKRTVALFKQVLQKT